MSQETDRWLNTMILIGFTEKRGNAWHYKESEQGVEPNHYVGPVPKADVQRRLFSWEPTEGTYETTYMIGDEMFHLADEGRKSIVRPKGSLGPDDEGAVLGSFKSGFTIHPYNEWLIAKVEQMLGDAVQIGSAGLLTAGSRAWVQVEMPESIKTPEGVEYRPFITAATSVDGTLSTTYMAGKTLTVCDNTLAAALGESGAAKLKIKHSKNSLGRISQIANMREALDLMFKVSEEFAAEVAALTAVKVTPKQWSKFVNLVAPTEGKEKNALTLAENKQAKLTTLWKADERVAPWNGTAWGVVQAMNTYNQHESIVRGTIRPERNMLNFLSGKTAEQDDATLETLGKVVSLAK